MEQAPARQRRALSAHGRDSKRRHLGLWTIDTAPPSSIRRWRTCWATRQRKCSAGQSTTSWPLRICRPLAHAVCSAKAAPVVYMNTAAHVRMGAQSGCWYPSLPSRTRRTAFAGAVAMVTNITDRKRLLEEQQRADKLQAVGTLAGRYRARFQQYPDRQFWATSRWRSAIWMRGVISTIC